MKILHITDSHGTVKGPESRKDIYYISFLKKFYEIGLAIKKFNIDMVIHTGDLFHTARVSDKFAGQVSEMIKAWGVPVYVVPGNHDIEGYTIDTIDQTKLGLLAKAGVVKLLTRDNPVVLNIKQDSKQYSISISGQEYYADIDTGNMSDFEMQNEISDFNILAIHGYISDIPQHPDIRHTLCKDITSDADVILSGHYHRQFEWSDGQNLDIFNPGSMMRVEQTEYNKTHIPQYGILDISIDDTNSIVWDYKFHKFKVAEPSTTIFDYNSKYKTKNTLITLDSFRNSIANTVVQASNTTNIVQIIKDICNQIQVSQNITIQAVQKYNDALQNYPEEFSIQNGYIENKHTKKIKRVIINNFQSHTNTIVDFDDGLNIIIGESNNGKTSIMRAIMWVIDNNPLGSDFITVGQDTCSVSIEFDDGTSITRTRTRQNTGKYIVTNFDENGTLVTQTYSGFTNAIPVEIANTHQMPKVNITKDIETHLNVLSQLDEPFLINESPANKAIAIGRITGTHILDASIKDIGKTILNNNKTIKIYNENIEQKRKDLDSLLDIDLLEQMYNKYNLITDALKKMDNVLSTLNNHIVKLDYLNKNISIQNDNLNVAKKIIKFGNIIKNTKDKVIELNRLAKFKEDIAHVYLDISSNNARINNFNNIKGLNNITKYATELNIFINNVSTIISKISICNNNINKQEDMANVNNKLAEKLKKITKYCITTTNFLKKVITDIDNIDNKIVQCSELENSISSFSTILESIQTEIDNTKAKRFDFVSKNGLCPCCGQKLSTIKSSNAVIEFFSKS